jgi:hypothetical protein
MFRNTVRSISTGGVSRKSNWDETAQVKVWLKIASANQKERDGKEAFYMAATFDLP